MKLVKRSVFCLFVHLLVSFLIFTILIFLRQCLLVAEANKTVSTQIIKMVSGKNKYVEYFVKVHSNALIKQHKINSGRDKLSLLFY